MHIDFDRICFRYPNSAGDLFSDLSFRIAAPGFHALFGPSGVGKTTLARMLTGAVAGFSGAIRTEGVRQVFYTYNLERLPGWSSVREHLAETTPAANRTRMEELIAACGIESCVGARFNRLSMGQQNRANLVRYLLQDFDVLVMDESLANVDELTREKIILKIKALFPERCFFYISHNVAEVARFCRQILILRGVSKSPQVVAVQGTDLVEGAAPLPERLERVMLEIVHAA
ncbi:MAG TPA: ATP-binding cassette domain-containing protein [Desulfobacterales bacterium]|jgi:ABC-type multidrug transport system ATPase subunit|nr:ATP-binding cassette domain-containing protein [Desulfobacterales bacterium]